MKMKIKGIIDIDLVNFKLACMTIEMPRCKDYKCNKECGSQVCQNSDLAAAPDIDISISSIVEMYLKNEIAAALCFQGLEPFDSYQDMKDLIAAIRETKIDDPIVIYTGYTEAELKNQLTYLRQYKNIIVKFGRFIPNQSPHYDNILGVNLASDNQYAKKIS